jgi:prepilin-type N-terminal cleavage/methylation domain-containing protein/prepilin-type processing-associated H-X9-DG protein
MKSNKKAFTLIELLVVIAIIAILAAILFPVFAAAKRSAKTTASLSNAKQITLAELMYSADYDDKNVIVGAWQSTDPDAWCSSPTACWASWGLLQDPYTKNTQLLQSPLSNVGIRANEIVRRSGTRYMEYGYNYTYLSPSRCCTWPTPITGLSSTAVASPAETIMFTERVSRDYLGIWWYGPNVGWMIMGTVEAPDCYTVPTVWCSDGWGFDSFWAAQVSKKEEGKETGLNAWRNAGKVPTTFADGHVKNMNYQALAVGTNWTPTAPVATIVNQNPALYLWDID